MMTFEFDDLPLRIGGRNLAGTALIGSCEVDFDVTGDGWLIEQITIAGAAKGKPDLVALRVVVRGTKNGISGTRAWEVLDRYDAEHGISAMMRTTGYTLSITGQLQASGAIAAGVHTPDECLPATRYFAMLAERGVMVTELAPAAGQGDLHGTQ